MLSTLLSKQASHYFPAVCCMLAAILWGVLWYPLRLLETMGFHGLWSALLLYCVASVFIINPCWRLRERFLRHKLEFFLLALFAGWTNLAFILAMLEGEVVRVLLLFYLSPIWAILMAVFILRERLTTISIIALAIAMFGAVMMLWQPDSSFMSGFSLADFYALSSGVAFAVTNIVVRKIGDVPTILKMGSAWIGVISLTLIGLLFTKIPLPQIGFDSAILISLLGFPLMFVMTWTAQYGVTHLPIQRSSIIFLLEIVAGAVSAAYLTNEIVRNIEYLGGALIISGGLISVIKGKDHKIST